MEMGAAKGNSRAAGRRRLLQPAVPKWQECCGGHGSGGWWKFWFAELEICRRLPVQTRESERGNLQQSLEYRPHQTSPMFVTRLPWARQNSLTQRANSARSSSTADCCFAILSFRHCTIAFLASLATSRRGLSFECDRASAANRPR